MTYSIVALDAAKGELGVAVATCWPAVGASVPWVEPGVGAVATQSFTNVDLGPQTIALMRQGVGPAEAVARLLAADPGAEVRQVGVVDAVGRSSAHTGARCVAEAGHACAPGVSAQGNMLERPLVWESMLASFQAASGDLADRLVAALVAAEALGGDIRGRRSAALLVAPGAGDGTSHAPWARRFDLRVDDHDQPLDELSRLLRVARGYEALDDALTAAESSLDDALPIFARAHDLAPHDPQVELWHRAALEAAGRHDGAATLSDLLGREPGLAAFVARSLDAGHGGILAATLGAVRPPA